LVAYAVGPVKNISIIVRQEDKAKVLNFRVIANEECIPKHKLSVMDMWFNTTNGVRSSNRECLYGSSRKKTHEGWSKIR